MTEAPLPPNRSMASSPRPPGGARRAGGGGGAVARGAAGVGGRASRVAARGGFPLARGPRWAAPRPAAGWRLPALFPPLALDGPCVTIRRFRARPVDLAAF